MTTWGTSTWMSTSGEARGGVSAGTRATSPPIGHRAHRPQQPNYGVAHASASTTTCAITSASSPFPPGPLLLPPLSSPHCRLPLAACPSPSTRDVAGNAPRHRLVTTAHTTALLPLPLAACPSPPTRVVGWQCTMSPPTPPTLPLSLLPRAPPLQQGLWAGNAMSAAHATSPPTPPLSSSSSLSPCAPPLQRPEIDRGTHDDGDNGGARWTGKQWRRMTTAERDDAAQHKGGKA
ncbi:hypothetical protein BJ912DRAFT_1093091 [Pholiota molesta]|nr:hypothetical protein BJ912DRAFT_1093091 [Pholiota molesta]